MNKEFPAVPLGEILTSISRPEIVEPDKTYQILGAHWYAKGLYIKEIKLGSEIQADKMYRIEQGDFVYNRLFAWKGSFEVATAKDHNCYVSNEFPSFTINRDKVSAQYLRRYFGRASAWDEALGLSSGGTPTSRNRLKEDKLLSMKIPLPPLEEQQRIVVRIEELVAKIEKAQGVHQGAGEYVNAFMLTNRTKVFEEASTHGTRYLYKVATLERGKFSHRPRNDPYFFGGNHPWIQIAEIEAAGKYIESWTQTLNDNGLSISKKFPQGTLLVSIAATIGSVGILNFDCCVPDSIVAVTPLAGISSEYLYHYFCYLRSNLEYLAPQSTQKNINLEILSPLPVPYLPLWEQNRIVAYLDNLQSKIDILTLKQAEISTELNAMLPSILDKAFKGEL